MESVGEASKLMDELNLDKMQDEGGINKSVQEEKSTVGDFGSAQDNSPKNETSRIAEESVEITEFGVPIRVSNQKISPSPVREHSDNEENSPDHSSSVFKLWDLDSLQHSQDTSSLTVHSTFESDEALVKEEKSENVLLPQHVENHSLSNYSSHLSSSRPHDENEHEENLDFQSIKHIPSSIEPSENSSDDQKTNMTSSICKDSDSPSNSTFCGAAANKLMLNAKTGANGDILRRSFFDEDETEGNAAENGGFFAEDDPIYQRVEQNRLNPPPPRSYNQSMFPGGSALFAPSPSTKSLASGPPLEQSRFNHISSKAITCVMWLLRIAWNIVSSFFVIVASGLRSAFDCPSSSDTLSIDSANNFCDAMQQPVSRSRLLHQVQIFLFNTIVSNNFIAVITILFLATAYWKFRRYGTDSGD